MNVLHVAGLFFIVFGVVVVFRICFEARVGEALVVRFLLRVRTVCWMF